MTGAYLARRLAQLVPTVAVILLVGFLLIQLAPGDPVLAIAGQHGNAEYYAAMRERFGLDRSLPEQLWAYVTNVLRGDFGVSYLRGRPAMDIVVERVPATLLLAVTSLCVSSVVGVALGVAAALRAGRPADVSITTVTLGLYAAPVFWVAQLAMLAFALHLGLFPVQGVTSAGGPDAGLARMLDIASHLALPALVLASQEIAAVARLTRSSLLEQLRADYVRTAFAKGASTARTVTRHGLRLALLPVVTIIGARVGHLLAGAVVVEVVFGWPGLGRLLVTSVERRDSPVVLAIFLVVAASVVIANLLTDLTYGRLDPRIRFGRR